MSRFIAVFIFILIGYLRVCAQHYEICGKVVDQDTHEALAFVNISCNGSKTGTTTNMDGFFSISSSLPIIQLTYRYVGYQSQTIPLELRDEKQVVRVSLKKSEADLPKVSIVFGENPAHRIIENVIINRKKNNPEKTTSFSYTSYNKLHFALQEDSDFQKKCPPENIDSFVRDSTNTKIARFLKKHHLFSMVEFVSLRYFQLPDNNHEEIISSRGSGFSNPSFTILGTQMQTFGFYDDMVTMLNKKYLNPVSKGSIRKYSFVLLDTFITATYDTLFVLSFGPKKGKHFDGLRGLLYINSNGYALQNVIAEPASKNDVFAVRIQQRYELIDRKQWFPTESRTELLFKSMKLKTKNKELYPAGIGESYIKDIKFNPDCSKIKFNQTKVQLPANASKKTDSIWHNYKPLPYAIKDSAVLRIVDSVERAQQFDKKVKVMDAVVSGYITLGIWDIDYRKYFTYNRYEGIRLGLGLMTNRKVSSFFSVGGYVAYGFRDKGWKYSPTLQLFPKWESETRLTLRYTRDVWETGQYTFFDDRLMNSTEWYRDIVVNQMDWVKEKEIALSFRSLKFLKVNLYLNHAAKHIDNHSFISNDAGVPVISNDFNFTEVGISLKFGYKEKFIVTPAKRRLSMGTPYPMIWVNLKRGLAIWDSKFAYSKYEVKISEELTSKVLGQSKITLVTGKVVGDIPITNLYYGRGSYQRLALEAENSFGTMRLNEFCSSEFISLFLKHNFGSLLFRFPKFSPELCMVTNIGYGRLRNRESHQIDNIKTLDKGFYESGILITKLLNQPLFSMGVGVLYRYGQYSFSKVIDNFAFKITLNFNL